MHACVQSTAGWDTACGVGIKDGCVVHCWDALCVVFIVAWCGVVFGVWLPRSRILPVCRWAQPKPVMTIMLTYTHHTAHVAVASKPLYGPFLVVGIKAHLPVVAQGRSAATRTATTGGVERPLHIVRAHTFCAPSVDKPQHIVEFCVIEQEEGQEERAGRGGGRMEVLVVMRRL